MLVQKIKLFLESIRNTLSFLQKKENCEFCARYEHAVSKKQELTLLITVTGPGLEKFLEWMTLTGKESYTKIAVLLWAVAGWIIDEQSENKVILSVSREALEKIYAVTSDDEVTELVSYIKTIDTPPPETALEKPEEAKEQ